MNSGLSTRGMILRNFRANQFNLNLIYISLVENTITFHSLFTFSPFTHTIDCMLNYAHPHPGTCECTCILYCNQHNCNMNYIIIRTAVAEGKITTLLRVTSNFQPFHILLLDLFQKGFSCNLRVINDSILKNYSKMITSFNKYDQIN